MRSTPTWQCPRRWTSSTTRPSAVASCGASLGYGVLASEGVNVPIFVRKGAVRARSVDAWTGLQADQRDLPGRSMTSGFWQRRCVADLLPPRAGQASAGRCRSCRALWTRVKDQLGIRPASLTGELTIERVFHAWNCLEDQRMETAVVSDSPRKGCVPHAADHDRRTPAHAEHHGGQLSAAGVAATYLPRKLRRAARSGDVHRPPQHGRRWKARRGAGRALIEEIVTSLRAGEGTFRPCLAGDLRLAHDLLQEIRPIAKASDSFGLRPAEPAQAPEAGKDVDQPG